MQGIESFLSRSFSFDLVHEQQLRHLFEYCEEIRMDERRRANFLLTGTV